jgi:hypothetical protein
MKNNFLKLTALWMVVVAFAACQHDFDVLGVCNDLAHKNMIGYYTYTAVDSTTMNVTKKEYRIERNENGQPVGYYRESIAGQCETDGFKTPITSWEAVMTTRGKMSMMQVTVTLEGGETRTLEWYDNEMHYGGKTYVKNSVSEIESQNDVYADLYNTEFSGVLADFFEHKDTIRWIGWGTKDTFLLPTDTAEFKANILFELEQYMDTIKWYVKEKKNGKWGNAYVDENGELHDVVYVSPKASRTQKGKHACVYLYKSDTLEWRIGQINDRPMQRINGEMKYARQGLSNKGYYSCHVWTWEEEAYKDNDNPPAKLDSLYTIDVSAWALTRVYDVKKFDVLLKGHSKETVNGIDTEKEEAFTTISITGFNIAEGEATVGEVIYKLKQ